MKSIRTWMAAIASCAGVAFAQTTIDHGKVAYFVPEKRITINAGVTDPKGVKLARTYFKAGAQADYTFVPMQAVGPNRYVATLPAPSANTPSIEYIVLAQSNDGTVSRTAAYTVDARKSGETPSWQSASKAGDLKVYTEAAQAPSTVAGFTDSVSLDIVESSARLGAAAGLHGAATASSGGAAGGTAAGATAGGLSTAAIIGGVAIAGVAAAAAGSGGGGGGSSAPAAPTLTVASYAGGWSGGWNATVAPVSGCGNVSAVSCTGTWSGTASSSGSFTGTATITGGNSDCLTGSSLPLSGTLNAAGQMSAPSTSFVDVTAGCSPFAFQFNVSPRSVAGSLTCTSSNSGCTARVTINFTGQ
jgi:hypothetical protein